MRTGKWEPLARPEIFLSTIFQRSLFGETMPTGKPSAEEQRTLLHSFATRAFRRPVSAEELTPYATIVAAEMERGTKFEEAMLSGYKAIAKTKPSRSLVQEVVASELFRTK